MNVLMHFSISNLFFRKPRYPASPWVSPCEYKVSPNCPQLERGKILILLEMQRVLSLLHCKANRGGERTGIWAGPAVVAGTEVIGAGLGGITIGL